MIYIATVHWKDDRWIKLQRKFMERYIGAPFQVIAYLNDISPELYGFFDHIRDQDDPSHAQKLNLLAQDILQLSKDDSDIIVFMDGDAFPIAPVINKVKDYMVTYPLVAVKRLENSGDIQPHPCFCVTTIGFWRKYQPGWEEGFTWNNAVGWPTTDVGAGLLEVVMKHAILWKPLLRTNTHNLHPVLFGIYDDLVYHHGAGFREVFVRHDYDQFIRPLKRGKTSQILKRLIPSRLRRIVRNSFLHPVKRTKTRLISKNTELSEQVFKSLVTNPDQFIATICHHIQHAAP